MMRRRLCVVAAVAQPSPAYVRHQSGGGRGGGRGGSGRDGGEMHKFIRDNRPPQQQQPGGASEEPSSSFSGDHQQQQHRQPYSRGGGGGGGGGGRGGGGYRQPQQQQQHYGNSTGGFVGTATPTAGGGGGDWAAQLQRELFSEVDPLGGMAHKDYYRDPATGYSPQYAPRNFSRGGEVAYHHPQSPSDYAESSARREWHDHDVAAFGHAAREAGRAAGRVAASGGEREKFLGHFVPADRFAGRIPENQSMALGDQLQHSGPTAGDALRRQMTLNRYQMAAAASSGGDGEGTQQQPVTAAMSGAEVRRSFVRQNDAAYDDAMDEQLRIEFGLRAKERFDFTMMQRNSRIPFEGYDMDRYAAQAKGTPFAATQLPPNMPGSSMDEAQSNLRGGGSDGASAGGIAPTAESFVKRAYARNTVTDQPQLDEAFAEGIVDGLRLRDGADDMAVRERRRQRFGLGRQGPLVQDVGPDKRTLKKHTNDERLLQAAEYKLGAHRIHKTDEHVNPYLRGEVSEGVGHLLGNRFDIERREARIAAGAGDLTERSQMHLGTPVNQSVDEFVFRHRNARGERPLDYFKPFPDFRALRLAHMYTDTEGFSLMKQRPEFLEWELFVRYRAHHQRRRELALRHGLEPVANETAQERDARRLALDAICERTPFDHRRTKQHDDEVSVDAETLRNWFGVYLLPSPTIVQAVTGAGGGGSSLSLHLQHVEDTMGTTDRREHVLSSRYICQLLLIPGFAQRLGRGFVEDTFGKAPEPVIKYAQPPEILKHFTAEEQKMYQDYVHAETQRQLEEWGRVWQGRRFVPDRQQHGEVVHNPNRPLGAGPVAVVDVQREDTGDVMTIAVANFAKELAAATDSAKATTSTSTPGTNSTTANGGSPSINVDGQQWVVMTGSERTVTPLTVQLDSGELFETTDEQFTTFPLEADASTAQHHHLNYGIGDYHYNRGNYVETQDVLWEQATAAGVEGWSPATHVDGLRAGLAVRARRQLGANGEGSVVGSRVAGDFQRGRIAEYLHQPFFNPEPRTVTVCFTADGATEEVPLADLMIWQRQHYGPERTAGDESRRFQVTGLRRYIDAADPLGEKDRHAGVPGGTGEDGGRQTHFLDRYEPHTDEIARNKFRSTKQITEIDEWTSYDSKRSDNYRPLSISHRRDYIRQGYLHKYTPWEWIAIQEADQPIIRETMRADDIGASHFFSLNRYWRYKARPHGYVRNYENEVRDLFQFVDGVTPWKQAQKIRSYWEVRQHHPMPQFNRPEVAMHRNTAGLLPAHLWDTDKKSGKVKGVKDSVRDYQTKTAVPKWAQL